MRIFVCRVPAARRFRAPGYKPCGSLAQTSTMAQPRRRPCGFKVRRLLARQHDDVGRQRSKAPEIDIAACFSAAMVGLCTMKSHWGFTLLLTLVSAGGLSDGARSLAPRAYVCGRLYDQARWRQNRPAVEGPWC
jgi:hypothetical protein